MEKKGAIESRDLAKIRRARLLLFLTPIELHTVRSFSPFGFVVDLSTRLLVRAF
jgi:hypothetical protein